MSSRGSRPAARANFLAMSRQIGRKTPLVSASASAQEGSLPLAPPRQRAARNWFHYEDAVAGLVRIEERREECFPARRFELVRGVGGKHRTAASSAPALSVSTEDVRAADVPSRRPPAQLKVAIGPRGLVDCPGVAVEPLDGGDAGRDRPGGTGGACPATQVDQRAWRRAGEGPRLLHRSRDLLQDHEVLRSVEERKRRALAGRRQRPAGDELVAALHIAGGERTKGPGDLAEGQVCEVPALERLEPRGSQRIHSRETKVMRQADCAAVTC